MLIEVVRLAMVLARPAMVVMRSDEALARSDKRKRSGVRLHVDDGSMGEGGPGGERLFRAPVAPRGGGGLRF